jgi:hypothetical protein
MDEKKAGSTPIALRVLKELVLPLAGGVAYGTIVAQAKQMPLDGVTAGGVAFFCILAAQGLVLRAARSARSESPAPAAVSAPAPEPLKLPAPEKAPEKEPEPAPALIAAPTVEPVLKPIVEPVAKPVEEPAPVLAPVPAPEPAPKPAPKPANDFVSIRVGIEELNEQGALPEPEPEKPEDGQRPLFRNLAHSPTKRTPVEALAPKQLLDLKMPYQAVLNAAVNFEREVKRHADMEGDRTASLESLFEEPRFHLSKDKLQQLDTLRRIRNNILHGFETLVDPTEAAALVAAFDRAASWFDPANVEPEKPERDDAEASPGDDLEKRAKAKAEEVVKGEDEKPADEEATASVQEEAEKPTEEETVKAEESPAEEEPKAPVEDETEKLEKDEAEKKLEATKS